MKCRLCNKEFKQLSYHLRYAHNISCNEYKKRFNIKDPLIIVHSNKIKNNIKCPYCDKQFISCGRRSLSLHIKYKHPEKFEEWKQINNSKKEFKKDYFECPICHKRVRNIYQHIMWHNLTWINFCKLYNWNPNKKAIHTKEHNKKVSESKLYFYNNTEDGDKLKRVHSENLRGTKNPACRKEVREKISQKRIANNHLYNFCNFGTFIQLNDGRYFRSLVELRFAYLLESNNIPYRYEDLKVVYEYKNSKHIYLGDFIIGKDVIEIKSVNDKRGKEKYAIIGQRLKQLGYNFYYNNTVTYLNKLLNLNLKIKYLDFMILDPVLYFYLDRIKFIRVNNKKSKLYKYKFLKDKIFYFGKESKNVVKNN